MQAFLILSSFPNPLEIIADLFEVFSVKSDSFWSK